MTHLMSLITLIRVNFSKEFFQFDQNAGDAKTHQNFDWVGKASDPVESVRVAVAKFQMRPV